MTDAFRRKSRLCRRAADVRGDRRRAVTLQDFSRFPLERVAAPRYRHTKFARVEKIVIVFSVSDRNGVVTDSRRVRRVSRKPVALFTPLGSAISLLRLKTSTYGSSRSRIAVRSRAQMKRRLQ